MSLHKCFILTLGIGFASLITLRGVPPDAVITLKVRGTEIEVPGSGRHLSEYPLL